MTETILSQIFHVNKSILSVLKYENAGKSLKSRATKGTMIIQINSAKIFIILLNQQSLNFLIRNTTLIKKFNGCS